MIKKAPQFETARVRGNRLHARLYADILTGRLRPGEALSETRIAEQHGMSRTPVREVFQTLAKEGLLRIVPQIGTFVTPINLAAVKTSQFIREALESRAVRDAADRASHSQVAVLREQIAAQAKAIRSGDHVAFFALDETMHRLILEMSGHPGVWGLIASVKAQLDRLRYLSLEEPAWLTMIFRQHREIVAAIAAHDLTRAESAMQQHLRTAFAAIERIASAHGEFFEEESPELNEKSA